MNAKNDLAVTILAMFAVAVSAGLCVFFVAADPSLREALGALCQAIVISGGAS